VAISGTVQDVRQRICNRVINLLVHQKNRRVQCHRDNIKLGKALRIKQHSACWLSDDCGPFSIFLRVDDVLMVTRSDRLPS